MNQIDALKALLEKVEAGDFNATYADRSFSKGTKGTHALAKACDAFHGSLDAAKALHEAVLPGHLLCLSPLGRCRIMSRDMADLGDSKYLCTDNPARAWLIAILKALISIEESKA